MPSGLMYQLTKHNTIYPLIFIYILESNKSDEFYIGHTDNLNTRLSVHKSKSNRGKGYSSRKLYENDSIVTIREIDRRYDITKLQAKELEQIHIDDFKNQYGSLCLNKNAAYSSPEQQRVKQLIHMKLKYHNNDIYRKKTIERSKTTYHNKKVSNQSIINNIVDVI
tara:strand:- start:60 stop:557 length:498 start_codon:yes stop_codon:yes gene_type:complete